MHDKFSSTGLRAVEKHTNDVNRLSGLRSVPVFAEESRIALK